LELSKGGGGSTEGAGCVEELAGACAGAKEGAAGGDGADEDDVGEGGGGFGEIAAGEGGVGGGCEGEQTVEEAVDPGGAAAAGGCELAGQTEGEKGGEGARAHGGEVAETAGEGAMADGLGGVPVEAEVAAGDGKVGGDGDFFSGTRAEEGAVVADAEADGAGGADGAGADLGDEGQFTAGIAGGTRGRRWLEAHGLRIGYEGRERNFRAEAVFFLEPVPGVGRSRFCPNAGAERILGTVFVDPRG